MANFPTSLDSLTNPAPTDDMAAVSHSAQHGTANDILEALEAKVGVNSSAVTSSHDYLIRWIGGSRCLKGVATNILYGTYHQVNFGFSFPTATCGTNGDYWADAKGVGTDSSRIGIGIEYHAASMLLYPDENTKEIRWKVEPLNF
jgi:hypothetical protein